MVQIIARLRNYYNLRKKSRQQCDSNTPSQRRVKDSNQHQMDDFLQAANQSKWTTHTPDDVEDVNVYLTVKRIKDEQKRMKTVAVHLS